MKFLYIVSSPHGGSTLLSHVLGRHPQATNLGEVSFIPKELAVGELCTCGERLADCTAWGEIFDALRASVGTDLRVSPYGLYLGDAIKDKHGSGSVDMTYQTVGRKVSAKLRGAVDTAALLGAPHRRLLPALTPRSVNNSIRNTILLYEAVARVRQGGLVIDASKLPRKAPRLYLHDPRRVRVLHMVRDGRGVLASRMKYMSARRAVRRWNHYHRVTRHLLQRWIAPDDRRRLRYEDFVSDPESHLRSLCTWLQLDYSSCMLEFAGAEREHSAGGNPARFHLKDGIRPPDERWRTGLSTEQLEMFERTAGALNREFGYG